MKKAIQLLIAIGQIQDNDILEAHSDVDTQKKIHKRIVLAASIAAVLILLIGCVAFLRNWCATSFTNTEDPAIGQLQDGFSVELKSVNPVSNTVYAVFGLTAPEDMDFSDVLDIHSNASLSLPDLQAMPSASDLPANVSYEITDDGDGKKNTLEIVMKISPVIRQGADSAFGPGKTCEIVFKDIVKRGYDRAYEQELLTTKYAGQTGYVLTPEETERVYPKTLLVSGAWKFVIDLAEADSGELELLESPVTTKVWVIRNGAAEFEAMDAIEDVTLTSVRITPLQVAISFDIPEPADHFSCINIDTADFPLHPGTGAADSENVALVLKDGTVVPLFQSKGATDVAILAIESPAPIALEDIDYLQMSDGTRLYAK